MTVFGVQWTQATDAYVRPAESVLTHLAVTSPENAETVAAVAQASTYAPWSGMRRCNLWEDGAPTAYYGDRCYTDSDVANMGQAMVQIPKFWYTTDHGDGVYKWYISDTGATSTEPAGHDHDWAVHPAFIRDGVTKDYIYLGAYEAHLNGTKLESKIGVTPTGGYSLPSLRPTAQARGTGWGITDYLSISAVQLLYLVEYGGFNSQACIGSGISADTAAHSTGATAIKGNTTYGTTANTTTAMSYRGLENIYGNMFEFIDGINIKADYNPWIADNGFASDLFDAPYANTGLPLANNVNNFVSDIAVDATYDYGFIPSAASGANATTKLCDTASTQAGNRVVMHGGAYTITAAGGGMFCMNLYFLSTQGGSYKGARLMFIP